MQVRFDRELESHFVPAGVRVFVPVSALLALLLFTLAPVIGFISRRTADFGVFEAL